MGIIKATDIHKSYGNVPVIKGIDFEIGEGELVVFVGPSGCGKSTMLRLIAGLEEISSGTIEIDGEDVTYLSPADRELAMVFQSYALYPHMSVRDNMGFGLKMAGSPRQERNAAVGRAADILQLGPLLERKPGELSGGQRQRVAIGRAIVRDPTAFLLDEPLSNLDAALRVQMRAEIGQLQRQLKKTMIYVTHDQVEAMTLADRIMVFSDGIIQQQGVPLELYARPANLFVATFIGSPHMNILPCKTSGQGIRLNDGTVIPVQGLGNGGTKFGVRPEHVLLADKKQAVVSGIVRIAEHLGGDSFLLTDIGKNGTLNIRVPGGIGIGEGEEIHLKFDTGHLHCFDEDGKRIGLVS